MAALGSRALTASVLKRLKEFLPQLAEANEKLKTPQLYAESSEGKGPTVAMVCF